MVGGGLDQKIMPLCGSIFQAETCQILSLAENARLSRVWQLSQTVTPVFLVIFLVSKAPSASVQYCIKLSYYSMLCIQYTANIDLSSLQYCIA